MNKEEAKKRFAFGVSYQRAGEGYKIEFYATPIKHVNFNTYSEDNHFKLEGYCADQGNTLEFYDYYDVALAYTNELYDVCPFCEQVHNGSLKISYDDEEYDTGQTFCPNSKSFVELHWDLWIELFDELYQQEKTRLLFKYGIEIAKIQRVDEIYDKEYREALEEFYDDQKEILRKENN